MEFLLSFISTGGRRAMHEPPGALKSRPRLWGALEPAQWPTA
jgi:hypothetical protein